MQADLLQFQLAAAARRVAAASSAGVSSTSRTPRSSAAMPRVIGPATSERCLIGVTSCSIAITNGESRPPSRRSGRSATARPRSPPSASAAIICVSGVMVEAATVALIARRRSRSLSVAEARRLAGLRRMQAHDAPGQHVLLDDVSQLVGGVLALHREPVQPPAQLRISRATGGNGTATNSVSFQFSHSG